MIPQQEAMSAEGPIRAGTRTILSADSGPFMDAMIMSNGAFLDADDKTNDTSEPLPQSTLDTN